MNDKPRRTYTRFEVISMIIGVAMAPLALRSFERLTGWNARHGQDQESVQQAQVRNPSPVRAATSVPVKLAAYSAEFENWWGGADNDLMLIQVLEGKFVENYGVTPNDRQRAYIRETFAPAFKNFVYHSFVNASQIEEDRGQTAKQFMGKYGDTYFGVLLSFADEDQLKKMRQDANSNAK